MKLFDNESTTTYFESNSKRMQKVISDMSDEEIMTCDFDEWVDYLYSKYEIQSITLFENSKLESIKRSKMKQPNIFRSSFEPEYYLIDGMRITYKIPFDGDWHLLHLKPHTRILISFDVDNIINPYKNECGYIEVSFEFPEHKLMEKSEQMRRYVDEICNTRLNNYREMINYVNSEVKNYNDQLKQKIKKELDDRRKKAASFELIRKKLEMPLAKSDMSPNSAPIPLQRVKRTPINKPNKKALPDEYAISDEDYENIIKIIYMNASSMEKTARSYYKNNEEELRDHLLAVLNTHYDGASGETFRRNGKTDILVEFENNAAFIGECKIWRGEKQFAEAIQQLLNYSTWRDVKLSVIIFNKHNQDFQSILTKIEKWLSENTKSHSNIKPNVWSSIYYRSDKNIDVKLNVSVFDLHIDEIRKEA